METQVRVEVLAEKFFVPPTRDGDNIFDRLAKLEKSSKDCVEEIRRMFAEFSGHLPGFLFARRMNEKKKAAHQQAPFCEETIEKGCWYTNEDAKQLKQAFVKEVAEQYKKAFKKTIAEDVLRLWDARFEALFEGKWVETAGKTPKRLERADIIETVRALHWDVPDANHIMSRLYASNGVLGVNAEDLIARFALMNGLPDEEYDAMQDQYAAAKREAEKKNGGKPGQDAQDDQVRTISIVSDLEDLMKPEIPVEDRNGKFTKKLIEVLPYLERNSRTTRAVACVLMSLILRLSVLRGDDDEVTDPLDEIKSTIDHCLKNRIIPHVDVDRLKANLGYPLTYPVWEKKQIVERSLNDRCSGIYDGTLAAEKNDILTLMFFYCASSRAWRSNENPDSDVLKERQAAFFQCADSVLEDAFLPKTAYYHPVEIAILMCIYNGDAAFSAYPEIDYVLDKEKRQKTAAGRKPPKKPQDQTLTNKCRSDGEKLLPECFSGIVKVMQPRIPDFETVTFFFDGNVIRCRAGGVNEEGELLPVADAGVYDGTPLEILRGTDAGKIPVCGMFVHKKKKLSFHAFAEEKFLRNDEKASKKKAGEPAEDSGEWKKLFEENTDLILRRMALCGLAKAVRDALPSNTRRKTSVTINDNNTAITFKP